MVKIIAELGINHKGNTQIAMDLIDQAHSAGCWGIKFQYRNAKTFYAATNEIGDEILYSEILKTDLKISELKYLANYAKEKNLKAGISFFRLEDCENFTEIDSFDFFKVPSAEATNIPLIKKLLTFQKTVMVSVGGHSAKQIQKAFQDIQKDRIVLFHCVANYPAKLGSQNLLFIDKLKDLGFKNIGYSSHDEDVDVCFLAAALGAGWIERHLTFDTSGNGLDDSSSSEIADFKRLGKVLSNIELVLGSKERIPNQGERLNMQNLGTSLYSKKSFPPGAKLTLEDFNIMAPRKGLSVGDFISGFYNKPLKKEIKINHSLEEHHFQDSRKLEIEKLLEFAKLNRIALPIRLHDYEDFFSNLNTNNFEFHLSYGEVMSIDPVKPIKNKELLIGKNFSIHLPDYIHSNRIINPISSDNDVKAESQKLISKTLSFARFLEDSSGNKVPIIGSFSEISSNNSKDNLDKIYEYLDSKIGGYDKILPQWLPVYAWYFGGSAKLSIFNSPEDVDYVVSNKRSVCLDLCHLYLSANYHNEDPLVWYKKLKPFSKHYHLADATGVDGEGLPLGEGDIKEFKNFLDNDYMKVLEIWQGHHNNGLGFINAMEYLYEEN